MFPPFQRLRFRYRYGAGKHCLISEFVSVFHNKHNFCATCANLGAVYAKDKLICLVAVTVQRFHLYGVIGNNVAVKRKGIFRVGGKGEICWGLRRLRSYCCSKQKIVGKVQIFIPFKCGLPFFNGSNVVAVPRKEVVGVVVGVVTCVHRYRNRFARHAESVVAVGRRFQLQICVCPLHGNAVQYGVVGVRKYYFEGYCCAFCCTLGSPVTE